MGERSNIFTVLVPNCMDKVYNSRYPLEAHLVKQRKFNAGGSPSSTPEFTDCGQISLAEGNVIDTIESMASDVFYTDGLYGVTADFFAHELLFHSLLELVGKRLLKTMLELQQSDRAQLVVVGTLTADGTRVLRSPTIFKIDDFHAFALPEMLRASKSPSERALNAFRNLFSLLYICSGRVIATLRHRYLCIAPIVPLKGDVIGLLQGSFLPWVLRPQTENEHYNEAGDTTNTLSDTIEPI
ncbi:hypothetical protein MMC17_009341 [Xylographa soralifera]|nr:hypothetical protein [Xylographa soralifera]